MPAKRTRSVSPPCHQFDELGRSADPGEVCPQGVRLTRDCEYALLEVNVGDVVVAEPHLETAPNDRGQPSSERPQGFARDLLDEVVPYGRHRNVERMREGRRHAASRRTSQLAPTFSMPSRQHSRRIGTSATSRPRLLSSAARRDAGSGKKASREWRSSSKSRSAPATSSALGRPSPLPRSRTYMAARRVARPRNRQAFAPGAIDSSTYRFPAMLKTSPPSGTGGEKAARAPGSTRRRGYPGCANHCPLPRSSSATTSSERTAWPRWASVAASVDLPTPALPSRATACEPISTTQPCRLVPPRRRSSPPSTGPSRIAATSSSDLRRVSSDQSAQSLCPSRSTANRSSP